jgi:hyperpolarization activated cyclic nucleotide-gated potassium channel 2
LALFGTSGNDDYEIDKDSSGPNKIRLTKKKTEAEIAHYDERKPFPKLMIHPDGRIAFGWNLALIFLLLYTATIMPYRMAFVEPVMFDAWFFIELLVDIGFFTDVCVNLLSAYHDEDNKIVIDRRQIFLRYLKSWMLLDIVACIPFSHIPMGEEDEGSGGGRYNTFIRLLRLPRLYRIVKISRIFKLFKVSYNSYMTKIQDFFKVRQSAVRLLGLMFTTLIMSHIVACLWYFTAKIEGFGPDTWVVRRDI